MGQLPHDMGKVFGLPGRVIANQPQGRNLGGEMMAFEWRDTRDVYGVVLGCPRTGPVTGLVEECVLMAELCSQPSRRDQLGLVLGIAEKDQFHLRAESSRFLCLATHLFHPFRGLAMPAELEDQVWFAPGQRIEEVFAMAQEVLEITDHDRWVAEDGIGGETAPFDHSLDEP